MLNLIRFSGIDALAVVAAFAILLGLPALFVVAFGVLASFLFVMCLAQLPKPLLLAHSWKARIALLVSHAIWATTISMFAVALFRMPQHYSPQNFVHIDPYGIGAVFRDPHPANGLGWKFRKYDRELSSYLFNLHRERLFLPTLSRPRLGTTDQHYLMVWIPYWTAFLVAIVAKFLIVKNAGAVPEPGDAREPPS